MPMTKEEERKLRKDGLDVFNDFARYAQTGFDTIEPDDMALFRWYGVYQQRPNSGHFMLRIKVPNGILSAAQLREVGKIANDHGRGLADITTRQNFQFHWLTIDVIPGVFDRLKAVGISTSGACGDITRNVVGCPVAGLDADEYFDASAINRQISDYFVGNKAFSNLPRKYKMSVAGCHIHCAQPDINCLGLYGTERTVNGKREVGFGLKVGGGLSTRPIFAADMETFIKPDEVMPVVLAISELYRDSEVLRRDRKMARLKFLISDPKIGVGGERFREMIEEKIGRKLERHVSVIPRHTEADHLGIRPQKQEGLYYVGIGVTVGRMNGDLLQRVADIADEFSLEKQIRNTNKQNFIIPHVPEDKVGKLQERLRETGLDYTPSVFKRAVVSCTGIEFCNLAITETKEFAKFIAEGLEQRIPGASRNVRIHFSGCPNNCGQNAIADIGLRGMSTKVDGQMVEAYDVLLGGTTGAARAFAEKASSKILKDNVLDAIARLYQAYLDWAKGDDTFHEFVKAHTKEQLDAIARGNPVPESGSPTLN
ncbi:MAG: hypothetical protein K1X53_08730 [Candidatus Sumerlaeaceae bacterium]|nr:hypothetical protein [Candidatus Sumerlaeaceae bacterium]